MKKAVCSGYYGFDNFGDDAVLKVLVENFKDKYDLTVLSANPQKTKAEYNVNSLYSFDYVNVIKEIQSSDVLISGGGSLLQDATSLKSLLYYILLIYFAILFNKDVIIFAQGIGPLNSAFSKFLVKYALSRCKIVTVRDNESFELLKKWNINTTLVNDPVYNLTVKPYNNSSKVGVQLRSFKGVNDEFLNNLAQFINTNFHDKEVVILSLQDKLDLEVCQKFKELIKTKSVCVKSSLSIDDVINEIADLEYLFSMRFHSALIGYKCGTKVLPIVYDKKVRTLAQSLNSTYIEMEQIDNIQEKFTQLKDCDTNIYREITNQRKLDFSIYDI